MEKKVVNSFGAVTIPKYIRDELNIKNGDYMLVDMVTCSNGEKQVIMRKHKSVDDILKSLSVWNQVISKVCGFLVVVIKDNLVYMVSNYGKSESFSNRVKPIHADLVRQMYGKDYEKCYETGNIKPFTPEGLGRVVAYYSISVTDFDGYIALVDSSSEYSEYSKRCLDKLEIAESIIGEIRSGGIRL